MGIIRVKCQSISPSNAFKGAEQTCAIRRARMYFAVKRLCERPSTLNCTTFQRYSAQGEFVQKIPCELAKPDMLLAKGITRHDGSPLASEGDALSDTLLRRLNMAGVTHVVVQGKPVPGYGMGYDVKAHRERVEFLFRNHMNNIFMKTVCGFLVRHFDERL